MATGMRSSQREVPQMGLSALCSSTSLRAEDG